MSICNFHIRECQPIYFILFLPILSLVSSLSFFRNSCTNFPVIETVYGAVKYSSVDWDCPGSRAHSGEPSRYVPGPRGLQSSDRWKETDKAESLVRGTRMEPGSREEVCFTHFPFRIFFQNFWTFELCLNFNLLLTMTTRSSTTCFSFK